MDLVNHVFKVDVEGFGDLIEVGEADVAFAALDLADVGAVEAGLECQLLLGKAFLDPDTPDVFSDDLVDIFHRDSCLRSDCARN